jgi:hypothetical protein
MAFVPPSSPFSQIRHPLTSAQNTIPPPTRLCHPRPDTTLSFPRRACPRPRSGAPNPGNMAAAIPHELHTPFRHDSVIPVKACPRPRSGDGNPGNTATDVPHENHHPVRTILRPATPPPRHPEPSAAESNSLASSVVERGPRPRSTSNHGNPITQESSKSPLFPRTFHPPQASYIRHINNKIQSQIRCQ